jgi:glycosyltransferase involved in cell wall biosynthesis
MIVRNEAHIVVEALNAAAPFISSWVIVDTGSTDETTALIRSHMASLGIPGELHERPWRNFSYNRNEALTLAQGYGDYIWVMDADDTVEGKPDLSTLTADVYWLRSVDSNNDTFWIPRMFRDGLRVRWKGVVHEYATVEDSYIAARVHGRYHIADRHLGARSLSGETLILDRDQLLTELERHPEDSRSVFYLAQAYACIGDLASARTWYERRVAMGGWEEEVYTAMVRIADLMARLAEPWRDIQDMYLRAWEFRPTRAEPLFELARRYRAQQRYQLGYLFAKAGAAIPFPEHDVMAVRADVYQWRAITEQALCASRIGKPAEARALCRLLLSRPGLPDEAKSLISDIWAAPATVVAETTKHLPAPEQHGATNLAWRDVADIFLRTWEFRPSGAEALHDLAFRYRTRGRYQLGYLFARLAAEIPLPDVTPTRADVYEWRAITEQALCASRIGRQSEAGALCRLLLSRPGLPDEARSQITRIRDACSAVVTE